MYWIAGIAAVVLFFYWQTCRSMQVTSFTHEPYETEWLVYVAVGRGYGRLTPTKVQALRSEGLRVFEPRDGTSCPRIMIPALGLTDMVTKAAEIGQRHHLMLLW
jgi:hypothetical protein